MEGRQKEVDRERRMRWKEDREGAGHREGHEMEGRQRGGWDTQKGTAHI